MTDRVGQYLGNYRLLRLLGRGGFATVYLGEHISLKSLAALKVLHTHLNEEDIAQFMREAQLLAGLTHSHIVRVLDFAVQDGTPFLVMEYAPGGTLRQRHPKEALLPLETIVSYVSQVASALQYAHDQRLIHRDVKPENMLLNAREEVVLSDFGLAMLVPSTRSGSTQAMEQSMVGTTAYLAPEQMQGNPRLASDQYALGVVVYEWLCGRRPFTGTPIEMAIQHLSASPPPLRELRPDLSPTVEEVVLRALAKDPKDRFANVQEFAAALAAAQQADLLPSIPPLHISLLGEFLLALGETPVTTVDWPRLQSLFTYLLLHRTAPQSRSSLAYLLWPDSTDGQAHTNLRQLVHRLRHTLPQANGFVRIEKQTLQWQPTLPWTLDVADFERALAQAEQAEQAQDRTTARLTLEQAVEIYRGDLLLSCYDEWILPERERLRQLFLAALERLLLLHEREGNSPAAISAAQRLLRHDPLHEATYRHLMRLYAASSDRAAALRTYHTCVTILERELAAEPGPATRAAYERLLQKEESTALPAVPPPRAVAAAPLLGRQHEWERLQQAWQKAFAGEPHLVVLSGEAGIGKTRLAEELLAWVARQGSVTASARCYAAEGELAYAPVTTWLRTETIASSLSRLADPWLVEVARFVPELLMNRPDLPQPSPLSESWQRQRLFEALAHALLGSRHPVLLLLDDLQWCDRETLEWLHYLLRFDPHAQLLLVSTLRLEETALDHPLNSLLAALQRTRHLTEIGIGPLSRAETASLAAQVAGQDLDPNQVTDLYQETEGNPLFVVETVRVGIIGGREARNQAASEQITGQGAKLPATVQAVITARLEQLTPQARELVTVAAVIGRAFTFQVLAQASSGAEDALVQGLDELWQRRIVREQEADAYDFSHDKIRRVVYASLSTARRRLLHRRVAEALEVVHADRLDVVTGLIATHYERAGSVERAVIYYQRAAEAARRMYANADAILFYQRALMLLNTTLSLQSPPEQWREMIIHVYENLGDIFTLIGQLEEARKAYQEALVEVPVDACVRQAQLHRKIALTWKTQRRFDEGLHAYSIAEALLEGGLAERTPEWWQVWIDIQSDRIETYYWQAQLHEMMELVEKTQPVVEGHGTQLQRASFFQSLFMMNIRRERYIASHKTLEYARLSLAAYLELKSETAIAWARFNLGFAYLWYGDLNMAEEQLQATQRMSEQTGDMTLQSRNLTYLTVLARKRGRIEETRQIATQALTVATALQLPEYIAMAKANLAWVAWREGKLLEAETEGLTALSLWQSLQTPYMFFWAGLWPLISVEVTQNRFAEAVDHARLLQAPQQSALPDALARLLEAAIQSWTAGQWEVTCTWLHQAIALAQETGYL